MAALNGVLVIGCGKMGGSILNGFLAAARHMEASDILAYVAILAVARENGAAAFGMPAQGSATAEGDFSAGNPVFSSKANAIRAPSAA